MSTPSQNPRSVKIARKRGAEEPPPPERLIVQRREGEVDGEAVHYIRQNAGDFYKRRDTSRRSFGTTAGEKQNEDVKFAPEKGPRNELARRLFELKRSSSKEVIGGERNGSGGGKKRRRGGEVATLHELPSGRKEKGSRSADVDAGAEFRAEADSSRREDVDDGIDRVYKRPSRQVRRKKSEGKIEDDMAGQRKEQTAKEMRQMEELAEYLHDAALEEVEREKMERQAQSRELERETKKVKMNRSSRPVASPKISGQRAREMHRARVASNLRNASPLKNSDKDLDEDTEMADGDYIYDTYILAPSTSSLPSPESSATASDVGYLIIHPSDRELWETYIDDLPIGSDQENSNDDDEDENAEDYYGADYPEDELSEEDEFDRGAYGYRGGFGEESDGDDKFGSSRGVWSEDEDGEEGEIERMMDPFRARRIGMR